MKKNTFLKKFSQTVCLLLIAAVAVITVGCGGAPKNEASEESSSSLTAVTATDKGEGAKHFTLKVYSGENLSAIYNIATDKDTVGAALLELKIINGEVGQYGLMVNEVNGIKADNKTNYWGFYVGDEYATKGVDSTEISEGTAYSLKLEAIK